MTFQLASFRKVNQVNGSAIVIADPSAEADQIAN